MKPEDPRLNAWVSSLFRKLFLGYGKYFSKWGLLNSDGRRLLNEIIKPILKQKPQAKPLIKEVRKNPTLENLRKLSELYIEEGVTDELVNEGICLSVINKKRRQKC